jgi:ribosomal protein S18 acetylase RimI-like enzyme
VARGRVSPSRELTIRSAGRDDVPAVLDLWAQARSAAATTPDDAAAVQRLLERSPDALLVAEREGRIVGVIVAAWDGWRGNMYRLAVLPDVRRQGIARRLVDAAHERLRAQGARRVTALVAADERDATGLWRATGYDRDELIVRFVRNL